MFTNLMRSVHSLVGLQDDQTEHQEMEADRTEVQGSIGFTSVDQAAVTAVEVGSARTVRYRGAVDIGGTLEATSEKFLLIGGFNWLYNQGFGSILMRCDVAKELFKTEQVASGIGNFHRYCKFGLEVLIQANTTQYQQGCICAALVSGDLPDNSYTDLLNPGGITAFPHVMINCNINNSGRIRVPWLYPRSLYCVQWPRTPVWSFVVMVMSPLKLGSQGTSTVRVQVLARFVDIEYHGIHPRSMMNTYSLTTGANAMNLSCRSGTSGAYDFSLGEDWCLDEPGATSDMEIKSLREYCFVPGLCHKFNVESNYNSGRVVAVIPVNPSYIQTVTTGTYANKTCTTPLAAVASQFAFWHGDMVYYITGYPTRFHSLRLLICFLPGDEGAINLLGTIQNNYNVMTLPRALNCLSATFDVGGVGSTCVFRVPWCNDNPYALTRTRLGTEGMTADFSCCNSSITGYVVIMVYSPIQAPNTVASHVEFNVYSSMVNADFMCPFPGVPRPTESFMTANPYPAGFKGHPSTLYTQAGDDDMAGTRELTEKHESTEVGASFDTAGSVRQDKVNFDDGDKPQLKVPAGAVTAMEDVKMMRNVPKTFTQLAHGSKRHCTDNLILRNFLGRSRYYTAVSITQSSSVTEKRVSCPIRFDINTTNSLTSQYFCGPLQLWNSMYAFFRGSLLVSVEVDGPRAVDVDVWFCPIATKIPRNFVAQPENTTNTIKSGLGFMRFNTLHTGNVQLRLPFYVPGVGVSGVYSPDECHFGTLVFETPDSFKGVLRFVVYIAFGDDARFYGMRGPMCADKNFTSTVGTYSLPLVDLDEDVVESLSEPRAPDTFLYRPLRMEVGLQRLKYAVAELKSQASELDDDEFGTLVSTLCLENELYTQSGHIFDDFEIVQCNNGGDFVQRGFHYCGNIYTVDCQPRASRHLPVVKHGSFVIMLANNNWLSLGKKVDQKMAETWAYAAITKLKFNYWHFEKAEYQQAFGSVEWERLSKSFKFDLSTLLDVFVAKQMNLLDKAIYNSAMFDTVSSTGANVIQASNEFKLLMSKCQAAMDNIIASIPRYKRSLVTTVVSCCLKLVLKLVSCVRSGWDPVVVSCLAGTVAIDAGLELMGFAEFANGLFQENGLQSQGLGNLRDVASGITVCKAFYSCFDFVVGKARSWLKEKFGVTQKLVEELNENRERIEALMSAADDFLNTGIPEDVSEDNFSYGCDLCKEMRTVYVQASSIVELRPYLVPLRDLISRLSGKLRGLVMDYPTAVIRTEPTVIYLWGDRGAGKSLCAMKLALSICRAHGVDYAENVYTKPPGGDYWDGYKGQLVCLLDDLGQDTSDVEWTNFCQLVSCAPFRVNMASLENKGVHFRSPYIVCTSNVEDPTPRTVYCADAVRRRLTFKVHVQARDYYLKPQGGVQVLDVMKAKKDGSIVDMSCCELRLGTMEVNVDTLVESVLNLTQSKTKDFTELLQLWSQSNGTGWFDYLKARRVSDKPPFLRTFFERVEKHKVTVFSVALGVLSCIGIGIGVYKAIKKIPNANGAYQGRKTTVDKVVHLKTTNLQTQSVIEGSMLVQGNLCKFGVSKDGSLVKWKLNCLGIFSDWVLVPAHVMRLEKDFEYYMVMRKGVCYSINKEEVQVIELGESYTDLMALKISGIPPFRDIRKHFVKEADIEACGGFPATLATIQHGVFQIISEGPLQYQNMVDYKHAEGGEEVTLRIGANYRGHGDTSPGSCGGVVISSNNRLGNPMCGIHVAAGGGVLVSSVITQEMLRSLEVVQTQGRFTCVQEAERSVSLGASTSFRRSPLHDVIPYEVARLPSQLPYRKHGVDPLGQVVEKYNVPEVTMPKSYDDSVVAVLDDLSTTTGGPKYQPLTLEQAVTGIMDLDAINMHTSAGIPYSYTNTRKQDLIGVDGSYKSVDLKCRVVEDLDRCARGLPIKATFQACAKDELRPRDKVLSGNTRFILVAPLHHTLLMRVLYGSCFARVHRANTLNSHVAVGMDPESQFHDMYQQCVRFGDRVVNLDFRNFDGTTNSTMIRAAVSVLSFLSCLSDDISHVIAESICNCRVQFGNMICNLRGVVPSGVAGTSILNSIINATNINFVFSRVLGVSPYSIKDCLKYTCYGDDVIVVVKKGFELPESFCEDLEKEFRSLGMTVTSAEKGPVTIEPIHKLQFLKRTIRVDELSVIHPVIKWESVLGLLQYRRKNADFRQNLDDACNFMYHRGESEYNDFVCNLLSWCEMVGLDYVPKNYHVLNSRFYELIRWYDGT